MMLFQRSVWAHGGEDHGSRAKPTSNDAPQTTPIQPESAQNDSTQPAQAASDTLPSADITTETGIAPTQANSVLPQNPTVGFSESLFGLILIAPFGLTLLRRQAQKTRHSLKNSVQ